jgi:AcrR family transcriptional regulator
MESEKTRPYRMRKRAEQVAETRQRIVEATVRLHTGVGPAQTTISAIADEAGVTRATVYSHFPDEDVLFAACSGQWVASHPPPDPRGWRGIDGFEARAAHALDELYRWFEVNADDLRSFDRDAEATPEVGVEARRAHAATMVDALLAGAGVRGRARQRLEAVAAHVTTFATWDSLVTSGDLDRDEAVALAVRFLSCA